MFWFCGLHLPILCSFRLRSLSQDLKYFQIQKIPLFGPGCQIKSIKSPCELPLHIAQDREQRHQNLVKIILQHGPKLELQLKVLNLSPTLFANILVHIHFLDVHLSYDISNHILVLLSHESIPKIIIFSIMSSC